MKIVKYLTGVIVIIICFLVYTNGDLYYRYFPKANEYGVKYNAERLKRGVLPLPSDWKTTYYAKETKLWFPSDTTHDTVFRSMKLVRVKHGHIEYEEDHIVKTFDTGHAALSIGYNYDSTHHWLYTYMASGHDKEDTLSKSNVDSILKAWNFNYLQPDALK